MTQPYVPYETLARAEAYGRGLDHGFSMSGSEINNPITAVDAYNAGFAQGKKEI